MLLNEQDLNYGFLSKINNKIDSFCSCSPYIQNCNNEITEKKPFNALIYLSKNKRWHLFDSIPIKDEVVDITTDYLGLESNDIAVIVPYSLNKNFPKETSSLPDPFVLKNDNSWVPPRFKMGFYQENRRVSYLGEYPKRMTLWNENSTYLVSNDIKNLFFSNKIYDQCYFLNLILIPILSNQESLDWDPKVFIDKDRQKFVSITPNKSCLIKLNKKESFFKKPIEIYGNGFNSIPIFLVTNFKGDIISIEHSHPPDELFWGKNKFNLVKQYKKNILIN